MGGVTTPPLPPPVTQAPPPGRDPRNPWAASAFTRLARAHTAGIAGDALFAMGLAGSVFFSLDFDAARWRVALYLVLTIAPFAVAAPFIGPALDRIKGGRRWIIVASMALRALLCAVVVVNLDSLWFYPAAFGMLVLGKVYTISKSAVVPGTVRNDTELVEANSKLTVLSALAVVVAVAPGGLLLALGGARWAVGLAGVVFVVGTALALKLPPTTVAVEPPGEAEEEELRSAGIFLAGTSMAVIRGVVGFLSFMLAFAFKDDGAPLWQLGLVAGTAQFGFFLGAVLAPHLRRLLTEERILLGALVVTTMAGVLTALVGGLAGAAVMSMMVGVTGSTAKQAFDSILQRDAPDANRGRSFARFETRFQLVWVLGALVPIVVPVPAPVGFALVALATGTTLAWYLVGLRRIRQGRVPVRRQGWRLRPLFGPSAAGAADGSVPGPVPVGGSDPGFGVDATLVVPGPAGSPGAPGGASSVTPAPTVPPAPTDPTMRIDPTPLTDPMGSTDPLTDPTVVVDARPGSGPTAPTDPTVVDEAPDPARRWMRPAPRTAAPTTVSPPVEAEGQQGLLFDADAWDGLPGPDAGTTPSAEERSERA
jgi:MFS family permease